MHGHLNVKFRQHISQIENRYSKKWSPDMLADYCWSLIRETPTGKNKRQKKTKGMLINFFSSSGIVYRDIIHYLITLYCN